MSLVDDKVAPCELLKVVLLAAEDLERGDDDVKLAGLDQGTELLLALLLGPADIVYLLTHAHDARQG